MSTFTFSSTSTFNFLRVWVWILTILYVIQAIAYFIGAITMSANIDEVQTDEYIKSYHHHIILSVPDPLKKYSFQVKTDEKDRAIGVLVFFWIITVLDMIASISVIGALV